MSTLRTGTSGPVHEVRCAIEEEEDHHLCRRQLTVGSRLFQFLQKYLAIHTDVQGLTRRPRVLLMYNFVLNIVGLFLFCVYLFMSPSWVQENRGKMLALLQCRG